MAKSDELAQKWLQAMDILASNKVNALNFDRTVKCEILSNTDASIGEYTVTDSTSTFLAYSDNTEYKVGDRVQVTIPNGDWSGRKIIIGKDISTSGEPFAYTSPLNSFLDISDNLITNYGQAEQNLKEEIGLAANGQTRDKIVWSVGLTTAVAPTSQFVTGVVDGEYKKSKTTSWNNTEKAIEEWSLRGLNKVALAADFRTALSDKVSFGDYGLRVEYYTLHVDQEEKYQIKENNFTFNCNEFLGNPYRLPLKQQQAVVNNIDPGLTIVGIKVIFYQDHNFFNSNDMPIAGNDNYPNLFISNLYLSFGCNIDDIEDDVVLFYTLNKTTYLQKTVKGPQDNFKTVHLRWLHKNPNGQVQIIDEDSELPTYEATENSFQPKASIHIYQYDLTEKESVDNSIAEEDKEIQAIVEGGWKEIFPARAHQSKFIYTITSIRSDKQHEAFKAVIEYPNRNYTSFLEDQKGQPLTDATNAYNAALEEQAAAEKSGNMERWREASKNVRTTQKVYNDLRADIPVTQYYQSAILTFDNESEVPDKTTLELIKALKITCDPNGYNGNFLCYDANNNIRSIAEAERLRYLNASFDAIYTDDSAYDDVMPSICWYLPSEMTMIKAPVLGVTCNLSKTVDGQEVPVGPQIISVIHENNEDDRIEIVNDQSSPYYKMYKLDYGPVANLWNTDTTYQQGSIVPQSYQQAFQIKDTYSYMLTNNTVYCVVEKNNQTFVAEYNIRFGINGNNGTKYTFTLEPENGKTSICFNGTDSMTLHPQLFDYENNVIDIAELDSAITYDWYSEGDGGLSFTKLDSQDVIITQNQTIGSGNTSRAATILDCEYYIIKAQITVVNINNRHITLTAYLPIAVSYNNNNYAYPYIEGSPYIIYSSSGTHPSYYKKEWVLHTQHKQSFVNGLLTRQLWTANFKDENGDSSGDAEKFFPTVKENILIPTNLFITGLSKKVSLRCYYNNSTALSNLRWIQPLMILCDAYESEMMNAWDGSLTIDEKNGTILSSMVGAGIKDSQNRFSGVLMGNVTSSQYSQTGIGLYGFHEGAQSFGFNVNGTAFLGKSGKGQIKFDGNSGTIRSSNYSTDGTELSLNNGIYTVKKNGNVIIKLQPTTPYFTLTESTGSHSLLKIADNEYYLATSNFNNASGSEAGVKIDLGAGRIEAYNNFKIYAKNTSSTYGGSYIQLQNSSPYFTIHAKKSSVENDLIKIADNDYFLQSLDYSESGKGAGTKINLTNGIITSYNFKILAYNAADVSDPNIDNANTRWIQISSQKSDKAPLSIGTGTSTSENDAKFHVDWDGTLHATGAVLTGGKVGSWIIDPTNGHLYYATGNPPAVANATVFLSATGITNNSLNSDYKVSSDLLVANSTKLLMIKAGSDFAVSTDGNIYAKAGYIGGWNLGGYYMKHSSGNDFAYHYIGSTLWYKDSSHKSDSATMLGVNNDNKSYIAVNNIIPEESSNGWIIKMGSNFGVTQTGVLYAKSAQIDGSGSFSGAITATSGYIGGSTGWTIKDTGLYKGGTVTDSQFAPGYYFGAPVDMTIPDSGNNENDWINWNGAGETQANNTWNSDNQVSLKVGKNFFVTKTGKLYANAGFFDNITIGSGATFKGNLSAAGGTFSGSLSGATGSFSGSVTASTFIMDRITMNTKSIVYADPTWFGETKYFVSESDSYGLRVIIDLPTGISFTKDDMDRVTGGSLTTTSTTVYVEGYSAGSGFQPKTSGVVGYTVSSS